LRDNSITRQNFWGTPAPIWQCASCGHYDVIDTVAELEEKSKKKIVELHKPWIDRHEIACKCGQKMLRIPDVLDVWVDAGTASWNCLGYPQRKELFEKLYPADFIVEGKDQIRGWFNLLMVAGIIAFDKQSFKNVYMHGYIQDASGRKMSKSLGNYIEPKEVVDIVGADAFRMYAIGGSNPGLDFNYNPEDAKQKYKSLLILWNLHNFVLDLAQTLGKNPADFDPKVMESLFAEEERYMVSKLHSTIAAVTEKYDKYLLNEIPALVENLFLELSRTYVQLVRDKAAVGTENDKEVVLYTLYHVLTETLKLIAPLAPFMSEQIWQGFRAAFKLPEESVHLCAWPKADAKKIDAAVEQQMDVAGRVIEAALAAREKAKLSLRWPISILHVVSENADVLKAVKAMDAVIKTQVNTKTINASKAVAEVKEVVKPNPGTLGKAFGKKAPQLIEKIAAMGAASILGAIAKDKKFTVTLDAESVDLNETHIVVARDVPKRLVPTNFRDGRAYIDTTRTPELDAEGYAREIMRRVQALRKDAGLDKRDQITLLLQLDRQFAALLQPWERQIAEKVGAKALKLTDQAPAKKLPHTSAEQVKDKSFVIWFEKA
jgi:isoleucyl-tRNA synthetase